VFSADALLSLRSAGWRGRVDADAQLLPYEAPVDEAG
jgi:hypothetical protein